MLAPDDPGPEPDPLVPGHRVEPDEPGDHRLVQVVPTLGGLVHVAPKDLKLSTDKLQGLFSSMCNSGIPSKVLGGSICSLHLPAPGSNIPNIFSDQFSFGKNYFDLDEFN